MEVAENHHPDRNRPRRWRKALAAPALLFVICAGFFWKIVLTNQYTWLEGPDLANQVLPWFQFQAGEWHRGRIPLWDPYQWGGQSLIGQAQPGVAYPLNWILFLLPLRHGWMHQAYLHWYFVLIHFMATLFAYALCRDLKRSRTASVVAGCAFALGGWVGVTDWPQMLNSAIWAPLVFLYMLRGLRGERPVASAAASGAFFGMAWLGGHHQIPIFLMLTTGGVWLYYIFRKDSPRLRIMKLAAIFLAFLVLVSGLQTLPAYEYGKLAKRWVSAEEPRGWNQPVPYTVHSEYSLAPRSLLAILVPGANRHADPFIGVTALSLALLAVALAWKRAAVRIFTAVAAGGLLYSLGRNDVFQGILYAVVPMVEKARTPSFAVFIYHFGIAILIAYGIDTFLTRHDSPWQRRATLALTVYGVIAFTILFVLVMAQKAPGDDRWVVVALVGLLLAGLLHAWRLGHITQTTAAALALGLMLIEFGQVAGIYWPHPEEKDRTTYLKRMKEHADIAGYLRGLPWPARFEVSDKEIPYNFGDWYGIPQFGGYVASLPLNLLKVPWGQPRAKQLYGVNYTIKREPPAPNQQEVFQGASGLKVYWNTDAFPRVWAVHEAQRIEKDSDVDALFNDSSFDLRRKTFLFGDLPSLEKCPADVVSLARNNSGRVTIEADMGCRGMVVLSDNYFPGWVATVDDKPARIYEAYGAVRGVVVDRGKHRIEMRYRPASVMAGLLMTLSGLAGAVFLSIRSRKTEAAKA
jgi:hypothetical protein